MSRDKLLAKTPPIAITTKGGIELFVRKLTAHESAEYTYMGMKAGNASAGTFEMDVNVFKKRALWLVARVICDEKGKRVLSDLDAAEIESDLFGEILALIEEKLELNIAKAVEEEKKD